MSSDTKTLDAVIAQLEAVKRIYIPNADTREVRERVLAVIAHLKDWMRQLPIETSLPGLQPWERERLGLSPWDEDKHRQITDAATREMIDSLKNISC